MDFITRTPVPSYEIHLSHNYIPREGAVDILKAVAFNIVYPPEKPGRGRVPLWLRLEQNIVANADDLVQQAELQMKKIRVVHLVGPEVATSQQLQTPIRLEGGVA
eukprot:1440404-Amphidinium_carterae.1